MWLKGIKGIFGFCSAWRKMEILWNMKTHFFVHVSDLIGQLFPSIFLSRVDFIEWSNNEAKQAKNWLFSIERIGL